MSGAARSQRNAIVAAIGWWFAKRLIRKRAAAALGGLAAGTGLSLGGRGSGRRPLRWLVLGLGVVGGLLWWRRRDGENDDWGDWDPTPRDSPPSPQPDREPTPAGEPVAR